jgi:trans-aconitate methyltransferase
MTDFNYYSPELKDHVTACPCCKGEKLNLFSTFRYSHGKLYYQICSTCGLIFQSPRMDGEQRKEFYAENYRLFAFGQAEPPKIDIDTQDRRARHLAKIIKERYGGLKGEDHLDIGCGSGALIKRFNEICGCNGTGIEPDDSYREFAYSQGLSVYASLDEWKNSVGKRMKIVTMSHVLEHLPDPLAFLVHIREEVLSPNGIMLVEVPNLYFHPCFDLAHIMAYSPHTIYQILQMAGFKILYFKQHGRPLRIVPRYMTVLAEVIQSNVQSEIIIRSEPVGVKVKRSLGLTFDNLETKLLQLTKRGRNLLRRLQIVQV